MLLTIDIGNTNSVLATFEGDRLIHSWRVRTDGRMTADEMALLVRGLLQSRPPEESRQVTGVAACSTVPAALRELRTMLRQDFRSIPAVVVDAETPIGVSVEVDNPHEVGTDRVVNTLATYHLYGGPAVVVDFGTSTNFDVVGSGGEFLGGAIAPGIQISVDALAERAAQLRKVELVRPASVVGKNTVECLQSGILYGFAGQVDGIVRRILAEYGDATVVATGGLAPLVIAECETVTRHEPDLTLIGLRLAFEKNSGDDAAGRRRERG
jgi:type III pantothenate kinase